MRVWFAGGGTGGHLYPALGIARALAARRPEVRPFFIGARRGIERTVLPETEFDHVLLELHPLYRSQPWLNWRTVAGAAGAWRSLRALAQRERPAAVVATGGYVAGLALVYGVRNRIPLVLQEQNSFPGMTTRFFSRYARQIHLGFPEAARRLRPPAGAVVRDSGNPIEPPNVARDDATRRAARRRWSLADAGGPVLLVFGGSQGARAINQAAAGWVRRGIPAGMQMLWVTGRGQHDTYAPLADERVRVVPFISPMQEAYRAADIALARAGAMSTAELCAWGIPMVLVPLPTAAADHQTANARALEKAGAATLLPQSELTVERLADVVAPLLFDAGRLAAMSRAALKRARPNAAADIARDIDDLLSFRA